MNSNKFSLYDSLIYYASSRLFEKLQDMTAFLNTIVHKIKPKKDYVWLLKLLLRSSRVCSYIFSTILF